ncbi:hypothetical protein [Nostoc sp. PA-18-2419]|uniref:hypothetical protein n=1 Tax=Nostoc sp. PA-18-2419 TaxID=2575443 RepID=UPI001107EE88|nr:hypothetical protein [Nostoc sp. PA-18-2419]
MITLEMENKQEFKHVSTTSNLQSSKAFVLPKKRVKQEKGFYDGGTYYRSFESWIKKAVEIVMENNETY